AGVVDDLDHAVPAAAVAGPLAELAALAGVAEAAVSGGALLVAGAVGLGLAASLDRAALGRAGRELGVVEIAGLAGGAAALVVEVARLARAGGAAAAGPAAAIAAAAIATAGLTGVDRALGRSVPGASRAAGNQSCHPGQGCESPYTPSHALRLCRIRTRSCLPVGARRHSRVGEPR